MSPHASWLLVNEIIPRIASAVPRAVKTVGAEDHEELIQDATALAARMLNNVKTAGNEKKRREFLTRLWTREDERWPIILGVFT